MPEVVGKVQEVAEAVVEEAPEVVEGVVEEVLAREAAEAVVEEVLAVAEEVVEEVLEVVCQSPCRCIRPWCRSAQPGRAACEGASCSSRCSCAEKSW